jgi:hypothetical protein
MNIAWEDRDARDVKRVRFLASCGTCSDNALKMQGVILRKF